MSWSIDILIGGRQVAQSITLADPLIKAGKEEYQWYLEGYTRNPYSVTKARAITSNINTYAQRLQEQLRLLEFISLVTNGLSTSERTVVLDIVEGSQNDGASRNTIHQLHWELLEDPSVWNQKDLIIQTQRSIRDLNSPPKGLGRVKSWPRTVRSVPSINVLLVVARKTAKNAAKDGDIRPYVASSILAKVQRDFAISGSAVKVNIEIVRPGTLKSLENHLKMAEMLHGRNYFHIVHFDMHGRVGTPKGALKNSKFAFLYFSRQNPDGTIADGTAPVTAREVGRILKRHGVPIVVLNACESARANCGDDANIAKVFAQEGVKNILAMSFAVSENAVEKFLGSFYRNLICGRLNFSQAASKARKVLRNFALRGMRFNIERPLLDWFVPVVYTNGQTQVVVSDDDFDDAWLKTQLVNEEPLPKDDVKSDYELIGRDFDILRLEKKLLGKILNGDSHAVYVSGPPGVGKTAFLQHIGSLWMDTSFVDTAIYIDFQRVRSFSDFVIETLAQLPATSLQDTSSGSHFNLSKLPTDWLTMGDATSALVVVALKLIAQRRVALILDSLHLVSFQHAASHLDGATLSCINEFLKATSDLQRECSTTHGPFFLFAGRSTEPLVQLDYCTQATTYTLCALELPDSEKLVQATLNRYTGAGHSDSTDVDPDGSELLVSLLQGNPAGLVHFTTLSRVSYYPIRQLYETLHSGHTEKWLELGLDEKPNAIFQEVECLFSALPSEKLPPLLMLGWYWHEGPSIEALSEVLICLEICQNKSQLTEALNMASRWGYVELSSDGRIKWIHPLFTIYCRIYACAMVQHVQVPPVTNWISFGKVFASKFMGYARSLMFDNSTLPGQPGKGIQAAIFLLTNALSANPLRDLNLQYFTFATHFLGSLEGLRGEDISYFHRVGIYDEEGQMRIRREQGFQNVIFACKICLGRARLPLPVRIWPTSTIIFYAMMYRKFATRAELIILAEHLENLLNGIIVQSHQFRGTSSLEDTELGMALSLASSLAVIHLKYLHSLTNAFQKFIDVGSQIITESKAKFGASTDPMVQLQMSFFYQIKAEVLLGARHEKEAEEAWNAMYSLGFQVLTPENKIISEAIEKAGAAFDNKNIPSDIRTKLTTWYKHLKDSWEPLKAYSRGEKIAESVWRPEVLEVRQGENPPNYLKLQPQECLVDIIQGNIIDGENRKHNLKNKFQALDAAVSSGNTLTALAHYRDLFGDAFERLDLDEAGEYIDTVAKIVEELPSSQEKSDHVAKIRAARELVCGESSLLRILLSDSSPTPAQNDKTLPAHLDDMKDLMEKAGAHISSTRSIEAFKESIGGDISNPLDLSLPPATKEWIKKFLKNHLLKCVRNEGHMAQSMDLLLECQTILRDLDIADNDNDHERSLQLLVRLDEIRNIEEYSGLLEPTFVDERRKRVLLKFMASIVKRVQNAKTAAQSNQARLDLERCVKLMEDSPLTKTFEKLPDLYRVIEVGQLQAALYEVREAVKAADYSKVATVCKEICALFNSGSFKHLSPEQLKEYADMFYSNGLDARLQEATNSQNWEDGIRCCEEWQASKHLWQNVVDSPDRLHTLDNRDSCEFFFHGGNLIKAVVDFDQVEGFHHLEKLEALYKRQQKAPKFAGRRCPEVQKTLLDPYKELLEMQCKTIAQYGPEAMREMFSAARASSERGHVA